MCQILSSSSSPLSHAWAPPRLLDGPDVTHKHTHTHTHGRLPAWQAAGLTAGALALFVAALRFAAPGRASLWPQYAGAGAGGSGRGSGGAAADSGGPRCRALSDAERVKVLAPSNAAAHRRVATASKGAQALFDLGLLQAWGFERAEAAANFAAAARLDGACAMCRWGLAYAAGPYPNVGPGRGGEAFPVFGPRDAAAAEVRTTSFPLFFGTLHFSQSSCLASLCAPEPAGRSPTARSPTPF